MQANGQIGFYTCQNRRNPRQGIETHKHPRWPSRGKKVRIDEIPVRGLKPIPSQLLGRPTAGSQNRRNPRQGIEPPPPLLEALCNHFSQNRRNPRQGIETRLFVAPLPRTPPVRIDEIPVRGLKLPPRNQASGLIPKSQNRRNPRQGIETLR